MQLTIILQKNIIYLENFLNSAGQGGENYALPKNILTRSIITSSSLLRKADSICFIFIANNNYIHKAFYLVFGESRNKNASMHCQS